MVWYFGERGASSSSTLNRSSELRGPSPIALVLLCCEMLTYISLSKWSDHGSLVVKITDSWLMCHKFDPSTVEDPPYRGAMHVKSVEISNVLSLVWCAS
ncbi:hypothetical protein TNCV_3798041 [Trichonephila clavipes]|nr:hypothetical protein TNCV_3798041 [Trichonephila clavipes]